MARSGTIDNRSMNFKQTCISEVRAAVSHAKPSATQLAELCLEEIEAQNPAINAYLAVSRERALNAAAAIDQLAAQGGPLPPLAGVPIGIKDVLVMQGSPATAGSRILEGYRPPYDATVVKRLQAAGAVLVGKLNCDEFAMGSSNENSGYGPVRNPVSLDHVPGGLQRRVGGGGGFGDGGGHAWHRYRRIDSSAGVVLRRRWHDAQLRGVSRYGLIAFASSLDRVGPFAGTVHDAAILFGSLSVMIRWTPPRRVARPRLHRGSRSIGGGLACRRTDRVLWRGHRSGGTRRGGGGDRRAARGGLPHPRGVPAAHRLRGCDLLSGGYGRGEVPTWLGLTGYAMAFAPRDANTLGGDVSRVAGHRLWR